VAEQQPMLGRAEEQVQHDLTVRRRRNLPPRHSPVKHDPVLGAERLEHAVPPGPAQFRVVLCLGDEPGEHRPHRGAGDRAHPGAQRGEQVAAQRPGIRQRLLLAERGDERIQREQPLGRPAPVDGGLAHPRPGGDLLD
jgi:hypothetical protein